MERIVKAFHNSVAAFRQLGGSEKAFQQELAVLAAGVPLAFYVAEEAWLRFGLIAAIIFVMIVEVLNTGIEATCNAVSREFHADIKIAKDAGSLAVLLSICLAASIWLMAIYSLLFG